MIGYTKYKFRFTYSLSNTEHRIPVGGIIDKKLKCRYWTL